MKKARNTKTIIGLALTLGLIAAFLIIYKTDIFLSICDDRELRDCISQFGVFGPLLVAGLMAGAIVVSPIPSAPIALASGAAYGHTWGTIYVLIGAEAGAVIAFSLARLLGFNVVQKWAKTHSRLNFSGSQNYLMLIIFVSRLLPFISFDLISYAAGLSPIRTWRFALATLAGMTPATFLLAHFGGEMTTGSVERVLYSIMAIGLLAITLVLARLVFRERKDRNKQETRTSQ